MISQLAFVNGFYLPVNFKKLLINDLDPTEKKGFQFIPKGRV